MEQVPPTSRAQDLTDAAERVARLLTHDDTPDLDVTGLPAGTSPERVAAVDGGSGEVADGHAFLVGAYRGGAVLVKDSGEAREVHVPEPQVVVLDEDTAPELLHRTLEAWDVPATSHRDLGLEATLEALRTLDELRAARNVLHVLGADDMLLLDGALQARDPVPPRSLLQNLLDEAAERGVHVVGVCKSTSQRLGRRPALPAARHAARRQGAADAWSAPLPRPNDGVLARPHAARLNPAQDRVFRFDVAPHSPDANSVLANLRPLATNPGYPGYPVPLALAHNEVHLDEALLQDLRHGIRRETELAGVASTTWDAAFEDFHDVLDLGA